jgi:hypothetical protein
MSYEDTTDGKEEAQPQLQVQIPPRATSRLCMELMGHDGQWHDGQVHEWPAAVAAPAQATILKARSKKRAKPAEVEEGEATTSEVASSASKKRATGTVNVPLPIDMVIDGLESGMIDYVQFRAGVVSMLRAKL